jgi:hypothetical protein
MTVSMILKHDRVFTEVPVKGTRRGVSIPLPPVQRQGATKDREWDGRGSDVMAGVSPGVHYLATLSYRRSQGRAGFTKRVTSVSGPVDRIGWLKHVQDWSEYLTAHSREWLRTPRRRPVRDRLLELLPPQTNDDECELWAHGVDKDGYGELRLYLETTGKWRTVGAYRAVYQEFVGPIATGDEIAHICPVMNRESRRCVKLRHLIALPRSEHRRLDAERRRRFSQTASESTGGSCAENAA